MDEDDIHGKIHRLRTSVNQAEEAFARALSKADAQCLSALRELCCSLTAIHAKVAEAQLISPPGVRERSQPVRTDLPVADRLLWHVHDVDYWHYQSPYLYTGLDCVVTYNPIRKEWLCPWLTGPEITPKNIVGAYADHLAEWVVRAYPQKKQEIEEKERKAAEEAIREARLKAELDRELQFVPRLFALGCLGIFVLFLALWRSLS